MDSGLLNPVSRFGSFGFRASGFRFRGFGSEGAREEEAYLAQSVLNVVVQKSIPVQIRPLILDCYSNEGQAGEFVRAFTFLKSTT